MQPLFTGAGRGPGEPHFQLAGVPVRVELSFLLMGLVFGGLGTQSPGRLAVWMAVLFGSVLFHEMGHALAYRVLGGRARVLLYGMGGLTYGARDRAFTTGEQVAISLAGPLAGIALGLTTLGVVALTGEPSHPLAHEAVESLRFINLYWSAFNLLPVVPLDGGHVLEALLSRKDVLQGRIRARYVTIAVAVVGAVVFYQRKELWPAFLLAMLGMQAYQAIGLLKSPAPAQAPAPPREQPEVVEDLRRMHELLEADRPLEARAVAHQVLERAQGERARDAALRALAWIAIGQGEPQQALAALARTSRHFDDPFVWGTAIAASGDAVSALPHLSQAYARMPSPQSVAAYARCLVAAGRGAEARKLLPSGAGPELTRALAEALFRSRDFQGAAEANARAFAAGGGAPDAYNAACSYARAGAPGEALAWLSKAADSGFADAAHLEQDADLESLRALPEFGALLGRLRGAAPAGA